MTTDSPSEPIRSLNSAQVTTGPPICETAGLGLTTQVSLFGSLISDLFADSVICELVIFVWWRHERQRWALLRVALSATLQQVQVAADQEQLDGLRPEWQASRGERPATLQHLRWPRWSEQRHSRFAHSQRTSHHLVWQECKWLSDFSIRQTELSVQEQPEEY